MTDCFDKLEVFKFIFVVYSRWCFWWDMFDDLWIFRHIDEYFILYCDIGRLTINMEFFLVIHLWILELLLRLFHSLIKFVSLLNKTLAANSLLFMFRSGGQDSYMYYNCLSVKKNLCIVFSFPVIFVTVSFICSFFSLR